MLASNLLLHSKERYMTVLQKATLAGGCFWCVETVLSRFKGVDKAISGYMGGKTLNPTYKQICGGDTGHAEVVQVTFDPSVISFDELLDVFFTIHDPTTLNRQGNDVGTQYRSAIFYHDEAQAEAARAKVAALTAGHAYSDKIVTQITPAVTFYPAEDYHQGYFDENPQQGYCQMVVAPKVRKAMTKYAGKLKA